MESSSKLIPSLQAMESVVPLPRFDHEKLNLNKYNNHLKSLSNRGKSLRFLTSGNHLFILPKMKNKQDG